jgi:hypothetical protein
LQIVQHRTLRRVVDDEKPSLGSMTLIFATGAIAWGSLGYLALRCLTQFGPGLLH